MSTTTTRTLAFDPAQHGFAFPNAFVDTVLSVGGFVVKTSGRCGGMAYAALDYWDAGAPPPRWPTSTWAPGRVPPDDHWLSQYVRQRLFDSFLTGSALKFVTWSQSPDGPTWLWKGVTRGTAEDEVPRLVEAIDAGRPVPLGLVVARNVSAIGRNHQVLAYGYERGDDGTFTVVAYDNNTPDRAVRITSTPGRPGWVATNGPTWRGWFVQDYAPTAPRVLTRTPPAPTTPLRTGTTLKLSHAATGFTLHSHPLRYTHPGTSGGQQVTAFGGADDNDLWRLSGPSGVEEDGRVIADHDVVRLTHVETGRRLHSRAGVPSPLTHQQEVTASRAGDGGDEWRVHVDGGGPWLAGSRVRLVHVPTGVALHSHRRSDPRLTAGQDEVTGFTERDANDWWTTLELR